MVCKVLLLARFTGRDVGRLVVCGGEELRPDDCVPWELLDSAGSVLVLWELPDSVRCVPDPDLVFFTGRGGAGFRSPDPALTRGRGGIFRVIPAPPQAIEWGGAGKKAGGPRFLGPRPPRNELYPDPLCAGMASRLRRSRLPTRAVG